MEDRIDFGGYATRNDLKCMDGRTIRRDAFKDCDGMTVPLVWQHRHDEPNKVLGHAYLENRDDGVYAYGTFNNTEAGQNARELVENGDITALSIYANQLKQQGGDVLHGVIREVSLVLSGANPGAFIDNLSLGHGDPEDEDTDDGEAIIYNNDMLELAHSDDEDDDEDDEDDEEEEDMADKTVADIFDELTDEQKDVVYYMVGQAMSGGSEEGEDDVKHNVFEGDTPSNSLSHADMEMIFSDAKRLGSLRDSVEAHMENGVLAHAMFDRNGNKVTYGVADIDYLFPEARNLNTTPEFIKRDQDWVATVMAGVHHTPFSRIKSQFANITMDEARAKGYIKGDLKKEEVFSLLKRTTDPQTIYKKQKLDRDDIIDITDFDVVAWIKSEMRVMLNEELARAFLVGDGRLTSDDDHISEDHIRPIWTDSDLFTIKASVKEGSDSNETAKNFIRTAIKARKDYKGTGNPTLFTTEDMLTDMLLLEDGIGHLLYPTESVLATTLRVSKIVTVPVMENQKRDGHDLLGIIVNLSDYNVGADKGGEVNMFDDFDIDYNQQKYLIETRCSGALTKPFSAIVLELNGTVYVYDPVSPVGNENPSSEGWYEKVGALYMLSTDSTVNNKKTYYEKVEEDPT